MITYTIIINNGLDGADSLLFDDNGVVTTKSYARAKKIAENEGLEDYDICEAGEYGSEFIAVDDNYAGDQLIALDQIPSEIRDKILNCHFGTSQERIGFSNFVGYNSRYDGNDRFISDEGDEYYAVVGVNTLYQDYHNDLSNLSWDKAQIKYFRVD